MSDLIVFDTDILIDALRGNAAAITYIEACPSRSMISVVSLTELFTGVRPGREMVDLESLIATFEQIPVSQEIAILAGELRRSYRKSHNLGIIDTLIAATAITKNAKLITLNTKHFPMIPDLIAPYAKP